MSFRYTDLDLLALVACAITIWLITIRSRTPPESNWPLFYYLAIVFYQKMGGAFLEANFVYAGVGCAMMIRFEFMSVGVIKIFRFIEGVCLVYIIWRCLDYVLFR